MRCQRPSSITTRIKTVMPMMVVELLASCQRPSSITTRIKTQRFLLPCHHHRCQRPSSITTRIKTPFCQQSPHTGCVRDHLPLQQGLRLSVYMIEECPVSCVRDHLPLQQGLRHADGYIEYPVPIRDHLPLKQGLRLGG